MPPVKNSWFNSCYENMTTTYSIQNEKDIA